MPNYVPPPDVSDGQTILGSLWNQLKNALASYLNNGGIGDAQVSSNPAEKISESKLNLTAATGNHHARHEPGGADMVRDIKFSNGAQENASLHAARHAAGGADPLPAGSITASMLASQAISDA